MNSKGNTIFWAIIACLLWSTAYAGIKIGLQYDKPLHFAGLRFIISGLMILPFTVKPRAYVKMVKDHWRIVAWVTFLQTLVNYILFYLGMDLVPGALGAVIVGSQPLVTAIVAAMMHKEDKLSRGKVITIIFGIAGVILISAGRQALKLGSAVELLGVLMIFCANIGTATSNVLVSLRSKGINPLVLSSSSLFTGGIIIYLLALPVEGVPKGPLPLDYWLVLLWLSFMSAFAFSLWFKLLQRPGVKVSELNLWKFIIPVVGAILSWIFVPGENPEWLTITGMIIITTSLIVFFINVRKSELKQVIITSK
ncbi:MAG TPA: DMT family transporter [Bacteroidales bacterium]|nr:DMT family transporter [Bacteroidales bacterium]